MRSQVPSCCHSWKYQKAVFQWGRSLGMARHVHPWRTAYRMASRIARRVYFGGRPPGLLAGTRGSRTAHSASVSRAGNSVAVDIRVVLMPPKVHLTDQHIQGYFPNGH
jgi:hypothetical protein